MKRGIALFLGLWMALCAGLAQAETLTLSGLERSESIVWEESRFFDSMEKSTGVSVNIEPYTDAAAWQAAKDAMANGGAELPDVLFKAGLSPKEEQEWLDAGLLLDLAPLLEENAPNLWKILQARPDWLRDISLPDGRIASLPALSGAERQCCVWLNGNWLETLGLSMPQNIDEFTQALRAIRDGDPNGNKKKDEVPLSVCGPWEAKFLLHAWGLAPNDYNVFVRDGQVVFAPFEAGYREFVAWLKMALDEGLIDSLAFRQSPSARGTTYTYSNASGDAPLTLGGMIGIAPYMLVGTNDTAAYAALVPLEANGQRVFRELVPAVSRGTFAVTSACEDVSAALRWVDFLYGEEGGRLAFAGLEGADYTLSPDGRWKWNYGEDYSALTALIEGCVVAGDGLTPGLEPAAFMRAGEIEADNYTRAQVDGIRKYFVSPMPLCRPASDADEARIAQLQSALGACVDSAIANFAMGVTPLDDASWQAFLDELDALGAREFTALWQAKYDAAVS